MHPDAIWRRGEYNDFRLDLPLVAGGGRSSLPVKINNEMRNQAAFSKKLVCDGGLTSRTVCTLSHLQVALHCMLS
jgi:hypothetical protein